MGYLFDIGIPLTLALSPDFGGEGILFFSLFYGHKGGAPKTA